MKSAQLDIRALFENRMSNQSNWDDILNNPLIADFKQENEEVSDEMLRRSVPKLRQYIREQEKCAGCGGLETCPNLVPGHCSKLVAYEGFLDLQMSKCRRLEQHELNERRNKLLKSHKVPKDILLSTFDTMDIDMDRMDCIASAMEYCEGFANEVPRTGLYLHGSFGVGKSHIAGAMANQLKTMDIDSYMVYVPAFAQDIYDSFNKGTTSELIQTVKDYTVLIFDDIGAENLNPYFRDDVLGNILQHRMSEYLPTIFTSNLSLDELERHMSYTSKGGEDTIKARRIMERIRHFAKSLEIKGKNRRIGAV